LKYVFQIAMILNTGLNNLPAASATAKMSFSVLRCLKTCVSSAMKNDRICSLGLMHIHRDFEVDLYKAMEVFVSAKSGASVRGPESQERARESLKCPMDLAIDVLF
jgi:hypothetical protein